MTGAHFSPCARYRYELTRDLAVRGGSPVGRATGSCGRSARKEEDDDPG